jgi:DNA-binding YbaB/EbfC family protein
MERKRMKDLNEILGMAQRVQEELTRAQDNLDKIEVEGLAGGGVVKVRATAKGRIVGVSIDESLLAPSEKQILEDLVAAAFNDARKKADEASNSEMSPLLPLRDIVVFPQHDRAAVRRARQIGRGARKGDGGRQGNLPRRRSLIPPRMIPIAIAL